MIRLIAASLYVLTLCGAVAQTISNDQFKLSYTRNGIASLKHVNDAYDTDYISAGRTLGDVFIRYRNPGGSVYGWAARVDQCGSARLDHRTPIDGLHLAGAWTRPGGGFTSALRSGLRAARDLLSRPHH